MDGTQNFRRGPSFTGAGLQANDWLSAQAESGRRVCGVFRHPALSPVHPVDDAPVRSNGLLAARQRVLAFSAEENERLAASILLPLHMRISHANERRKIANAGVARAQ